MEATRIESRNLIWLRGVDLVMEREKYGLSQTGLAQRMRRLGAVDVYQQKIARWERDTEFCITEYTFNIMVAAFENIACSAE